MEGQKKRRPPVLLLMILVLFLTVGGLALAVQSFGRYDTLLLEQSDSQLYGLARSVDRSVSGALEQFIGELDYLIRLELYRCGGRLPRRAAGGAPSIAPEQPSYP